MNLNKYVEKGISFNDYIKEIKSIIALDPQDDFAPYYPLNLKRMNRLSKQVKLNDEQLKELQNLDKEITLLVITEGWCGDAAQIIPVINKLTQASNLLHAKMVYRDANLELMNLYLTNGAQAIPIVIGVDKEGNELFKWGPRPLFGLNLLKEYKSGKIVKEEFSILLQKAYNKDKGKTIIQELLEKIKNA